MPCFFDLKVDVLVVSANERVDGIFFYSNFSEDSGYVAMKLTRRRFELDLLFREWRAELLEISLFQNAFFFYF